MILKTHTQEKLSPLEEKLTSLEEEEKKLYGTIIEVYAAIIGKYDLYKKLEHRKNYLNKISDKIKIQKPRIDIVIKLIKLWVKTYQTLNDSLKKELSSVVESILNKKPLKTVKQLIKNTSDKLTNPSLKKDFNEALNTFKTFHPGYDKKLYESLLQ